ncbi:MAG: hypothetical protein IPH05_17860 [Flavobacteriales bacterium]|nr:hypothetical protein [Flavobacteriales bacterium]
MDTTAPFICNLCIHAGGGSDVEPICSVSFGSMSNPTCSAANCDAGYVDYTGTVTPPTVLQGQTYSLGVSGNTNGSYTTYMTAFFDWDQDGTFEDVQPIGSINNEVCNDLDPEREHPGNKHGPYAHAHHQELQQ